MRKLFLDDFRTVTMAQTYAHPRDRHFYNGEWDIVRSYDEFVRYIDRNGMPDMVSFDHDLADEHYAPTGISYDEFTEKSAKGLLCVKEIMTADGLGKLHHSSYQMIDQCTPEQEEEGALLTVFLDGKLVKEYTLEEIRERIKRNLYE